MDILGRNLRVQRKRVVMFELQLSRQQEMEITHNFASANQGRCI